MTVSVITISDRASAGVYEDATGPEIERLLLEAHPRARVSREIVSDDVEGISEALQRHERSDVILTTGGTGISPRDVTPEATRLFCDRELPGISEAIRAESYRETPNALLSRAYAGVRGSTLVINFPGSSRAIRLCMRVVAPILEHAARMMRGESH